MREKQKKNQTKKNTQKRMTSNYDADFTDLGIEPPKIYRQSQQRNAQTPKPKKSKSKANNLTKNERRTKETKKRKKKVKLRKTFKWILVLFLIAAIGVAICISVFKVSNITASGSKIYSADKILSQCIIEKGDNLITIDTESAQKRIEQNLPYAYKAQIKRKLPDTVVITVTDAKPAYSLLCKDKTYILLDDNFKVLEKGAQMSSGVVIKQTPVKTAKPGYKIKFKNEDIGTCLQKLAACVKNNNYAEITSIYSKNISDNYAVYDNRITFKLGNCDDLENKILKGLAACDKLNESNPNATGTMTITTDKSIYFTEK